MMHYLREGFLHVIPLGFDHILFILGIFFLNSELRSVILQCTVFTLAHSVSLFGAATGMVDADPLIVEPVIALSILFTAVGNILQPGLKPRRLLLIFLFGLVHGLGFAAAFSESGLKGMPLLTALAGFNIGVEAAQVTVVLAAWLLVARWFRKKPWYQDRIVFPLSTVIACISVYWIIERIFFHG